MASAELSRRVEKVVAYPPLCEMSDRQRGEFHEALLDADDFDDLPGNWQAAILEAEQNHLKAAGYQRRLSLVGQAELALVCAASAAAVDITFDGDVLRYRAQESECFGLVVGRGAQAEGPFLAISMGVGPSHSVHVGLGCHKAAVFEYGTEVHCPLVSGPNDQPRYRFTLGAGDITFRRRLSGVLYAGRGRDYVIGADRVYGGAGNDIVVDAARVYAGPGNDQVHNEIGLVPTAGVYGGPGHDLLGVGGLMYGGPGPDHLSDLGAKSGDMLVGGPGRDRVRLSRDLHSDVVRVRGGGVDRVHCPAHPDRDDALFVDRSDRLDPSCNSAIVLFTERPRYPYR